jgi:hypothetical protein
MTFTFSIFHERGVISTGDDAAGGRGVGRGRSEACSIYRERSLSSALPRRSAAVLLSRSPAVPLQ